MPEEAVRIGLANGRSVSGLWTPGKGDWAFVYAPGAGSKLSDPFGAYAATALAAAGVASLRFQFPYSEEGRPAPDRPPVLMATWRAAIALARERSRRLVVGGRSMGGRYASMVVAEDSGVEALACFAYPLHPPGRPEQRRDVHLPQVTEPILFCSGDRDVYASVAEMEALTAGLPGAKYYRLAGADHGFAVLKSSGRRREDVWQEAVTALLDWLREIE